MPSDVGSNGHIFGRSGAEQGFMTPMVGSVVGVVNFNNKWLKDRSLWHF